MAKLGTKAVGSTIKLNLSGSPREFLIMHQGNPNTGMYDSSCNGTWVRMKEAYENRVWDGSNNDYANSDVDVWLNGTFLNMLDTDIREQGVKQVKIPYRPGSGNGGNVNTGANGLSCKAFLLSIREMGFSNSWMSNDGVTLAYYSGGGTKVINLNGSPATAWSRSPYTLSTGDNFVCSVKADGSANYWSCFDSYAVAPALILDSELLVSDDGTVSTNEPPTAPGSIDVQGVVASGTATITLTAATDPDGTIASYRYERSVDSGAWTQFADVNSLTQTDSVSGDWGAVAYRACAVDDAGEAGPYATSETETVNSGWVTIGGPDSALGQRIKPFTLTAEIGVSGQTGVANITVTGHLDGKQVLSTTVTQGQSASIFVDTRTLATGQHTIQMTAEASDYLPANKAWQFSVPMDELPDGGKAEQLWDDDGNAIFPRTTSQQVIGKNGLSIQNELDNFEKKFRGLTGHLEHVDTVYLASAGAQVEVPREAGEHYTFMPYPSNTNGAALVTSGSNAAANIGSNITVTPSANKFAIVLSAATASIVVVSKFVAAAEANVTTNPVALFTALGQPQVVSVSGGTTETVTDQTEALQTIIDENPNANYYILEDADGTKYYVATTTLVNEGTGSITGPVYRDDQSTTLYRNSTVYFGKPGSNLESGDIIKINENGSPVNFIIVHKGSPSDAYVGFDNGLVVLRQDIHSKGVYDSSNNDYANSSLNAWGNGTYLNTIDAAVRNKILNVKIPYRPGTSGSSVSSGENGLSCKVFFPSTKEVDSTQSYSPNEGAVFSYFSGGGNSKRIARYNGQADVWWLRSPGIGDTFNAYYVATGGSVFDHDVDWGFCGRRPAFVLPNTIIVANDGTVIG